MYIIILYYTWIHPYYAFIHLNSGRRKIWALNCKLRRRRAETENGLWFIVSSLRVVKSPNPGVRHHLSPHLRNFYSVSLTCGMGEGKGRRRREKPGERTTSDGSGMAQRGEAEEKSLWMSFWKGRSVSATTDSFYSCVCGESLTTTSCCIPWSPLFGCQMWLLLCHFWNYWSWVNRFVKVPLVSHGAVSL